MREYKLQDIGAGEHARINLFEEEQQEKKVRFHY